MEAKNVLSEILRSQGFTSYLDSCIKETNQSGRECNFGVSFCPGGDQLTYSSQIYIGDAVSVSRDTGLINFIRGKGNIDLESLTGQEIMAFREQFDESAHRMVVDHPQIQRGFLSAMEGYRKLLDLHTHPYQTHGIQMPFFSAEDLESYVNEGFPFGAVVSGAPGNGPYTGMVIGIDSKFKGGDYGGLARKMAEFESKVCQAGGWSFRNLRQPLMLNTELGLVTSFYFNSEGFTLFNEEAMEQVGAHVFKQRPFLLRPFK